MEREGGGLPPALTHTRIHTNMYIYKQAHTYKTYTLYVICKILDLGISLLNCDILVHMYTYTYLHTGIKCQCPLQKNAR